MAEASTPELPAPTRPRAVLGALAGLLVAVIAGGVFVATRNDAPPPPKPDIPLDAWAPYWALDDDLAEFK